MTGYSLLNMQPLRVASRTGQYEVVKFLIEKGANVHSKLDESLRTASLQGHVEVVELLLSHKANPRAYKVYTIYF